MDTEILGENDISSSIIIQEANRRSLEMLTAMEGKTQPIEPIEKSCSDDKDSKSSSSSRKSSIRHKIESASKLSKDVGFDNIEKCGRVPVFTQTAAVSNFSSEKPVPSKVRHVSSGTSSAGTDKNEKKQGRGRQRQRKKKRRHRSSSSSSSTSSG